MAGSLENTGKLRELIDKLQFMEQKLDGMDQRMDILIIAINLVMALGHIVSLFLQRPENSTLMLMAIW